MKEPWVVHHEDPYFRNHFLISLWTKCSQPFLLKNGERSRKMKVAVFWDDVPGSLVQVSEVLAASIS
jgi:hypothetical protein